MEEMVRLSLLCVLFSLMGLVIAQGSKPLAALLAAAAGGFVLWRALEMGGKDNTTCMILDVSGQGLPAPTAASLMRLPQER